MASTERIPLAARAKTFLRSCVTSQWRLQKDAVMQVIKQLSLARPQTTGKGISCFRGSNESTARRFDLRGCRGAGGEIREPESSAASQVATLLLSAHLNKTGEKRKRRGMRFLPLGGAK